MAMVGITYRPPSPQHALIEMSVHMYTVYIILGGQNPETELFIFRTEEKIRGCYPLSINIKRKRSEDPADINRGNL